MKHTNIFVFLMALSGLICAQDVTNYRLIKNYSFKSTDSLQSFYTIKLYDNGMGSCYMFCDFCTFTATDDMPSHWIFKNIKNKDMIVCKNENDDFLIKALQGNLFLPKYSKALEKQVKSFDRLASCEDDSQSHESFFKVYQFHKAPAARRYGYLFYTTEGRSACYEKFEEIFGSEALIEFQNSH